jgi:hypothetical protein
MLLLLLLLPLLQPGVTLYPAPGPRRCCYCCCCCCCNRNAQCKRTCQLQDGEVPPVFRLKVAQGPAVRPWAAPAAYQMPAPLRCMQRSTHTGTCIQVSSDWNSLTSRRTSLLGENALSAEYACWLQLLGCHSAAVGCFAAACSALTRSCFMHAGTSSPRCWCWQLPAGASTLLLTGKVSNAYAVLKAVMACSWVDLHSIHKGAIEDDY